MDIGQGFKAFNNLRSTKQSEYAARVGPVNSFLSHFAVVQVQTAAVHSSVSTVSGYKNCSPSLSSG